MLWRRTSIGEGSECKGDREGCQDSACGSLGEEEASAKALRWQGAREAGGSEGVGKGVRQR